MPTLNSTEATAALAHGDGFRARRTADGIVLEFPVLRAYGVALSLGLFALLCGAMPALGLSALLPLATANASALLSLALIGGFAAPFILASIVYTVLAIYLLANSLHVNVSAAGVRSERRVFGRLTLVREIVRADIADIEPRIDARHQNVFSSTPRYALIAKHGTERRKDVVIAEIEAEMKEQSPDERLKERQSRSVPLMKEMRDRVFEMNPLPKSALGMARRYLIDHWEGLTAFLEHAELPIDNNPAERGLRGPVLGRKNFLGNHSRRGAKTTAIFYSIIESCKLNDVDPFKYLSDMASRRHQRMELITPERYAAGPAGRLTTYD